MPRFVNTGVWKDSDGKEHKCEPPLIEHEGKHYVKVPPMFIQSHGKYVETQPGAAIVSMPGVGFWAIAPNEVMDLPHGVAAEDYLAKAPALRLLDPPPKIFVKQEETVP